MAHHLTPAELAEETGVAETEIIRFCCQSGVPIYHGRVDKTLFRAVAESEGALLTTATGDCLLHFLPGGVVAVQETASSRIERDLLTRRQHEEWAATHVANPLTPVPVPVEGIGFAAAETAALQA